MEAAERDSTRDWLLPEHARPPLVGELEARIEEALCIARASEAAVMTVGAAALEAAEQARRAAELAERASAEMNAATPVPVRPEPNGAAAVESSDPRGDPAGPPATVAEDDGLRDFTARADRLAERLRELERGSAAMVS